MKDVIFENRQEAGKQLARKLLKYKDENPYLLAMPRGGVPVAFEAAAVLHAPISVVVVVKIGSPGNPEYAVGAIAEGGVKIPGIDEDGLFGSLAAEEAELKRRVKKYRKGESLPDMGGKTVILIDDGMATGISAKAAIEAIKKLHPKKIVLAVPVCAPDTAESFKKLADEVICLATPKQFLAVATWYRDFTQVSDEEVIRLLGLKNV